MGEDGDLDAAPAEGPHEGCDGLLDVREQRLPARHEQHLLLDQQRAEHQQQVLHAQRPEEQPQRHVQVLRVVLARRQPHLAQRLPVERCPQHRRSSATAHWHPRCWDAQEVRDSSLEGELTVFTTATATVTTTCACACAVLVVPAGVHQSEKLLVPKVPMKPVETRGNGVTCAAGRVLASREVGHSHPARVSSTHVSSPKVTVSAVIVVTAVVVAPAVGVKRDIPVASGRAVSPLYNCQVRRRLLRW